MEAYEYVLRKISQEETIKEYENLTAENTNGVFKKCAFYLLEYENLIKKNNIRTKNLEELVRNSVFNEDKKTYKMFSGERKEDEKNDINIEDKIKNEQNLRENLNDNNINTPVVNTVDTNMETNENLRNNQPKVNIKINKLNTNKNQQTNKTDNTQYNGFSIQESLDIKNIKPIKLTSKDTLEKMNRYNKGRNYLLKNKNDLEYNNNKNELKSRLLINSNDITIKNKSNLNEHSDFKSGILDMNSKLKYGLNKL